MIFLQHILAFLLIVVWPVWDHIEMKRLKQSTASSAKVDSYRRIIVVEWLATAVAVAAVAPTNLAIIRGAALPGLTTGLSKISPAFAAGLVIGLVIGMLALLLLRMRRSRSQQPSPQSWGRDALKRIAFFLPVSSRERLWFALACVTAGICEEILYRGFLIGYLHSLPWGLTLQAALILSSVVFGVLHNSQGILGVFSIGVIGFLFGLLFFYTGNLIVPIVLHTLIDLRILLMKNLPEPEIST